MGHEWRDCRLGDVVELKRGYDLPHQSRASGSVPVISSSGPSGFHSVAAVRGPGVVTGRYGTLGQVFYLDEDFWPLNTTLYVRDFKGNDPRFIGYFLRTIDFLSCSDKAAVPGVNRNHLHELLVRVPPRSSQQSIANILSTLDAKIGIAQKTNESLETLARLLFRSWFVEFDPTRSRIDGNGNGEVLDRLFPDSFDITGDYFLPAGWIRNTIGGWSRALSGGTPTKSATSLWQGRIPWISPKVMAGIHADEAEAFVSEEAIGNGTRLAPGGSTLVMVRGMGLHQRVRVSRARHEVTFNQDVKALVADGIESSLLFYALLDAQEELLRKVESSGHGTGVLPTDRLLEHPIAMPPAPVQRELARVFDTIDDRIACGREQIRTLIALRDALLPKLVSGEVRVTDAINVLEAV